MQRFFEENFRKNLSLKFIHINIVTHLCISIHSFSQAIHEDERYVPETDSLVLEASFISIRK
jgi:hypothetical protein